MSTWLDLQSIRDISGHACEWLYWLVEVGRPTLSVGGTTSWAGVLKESAEQGVLPSLCLIDSAVQWLPPRGWQASSRTLRWNKALNDSCWPSCHSNKKVMNRDNRWLCSSIPDFSYLCQGFLICFGLEQLIESDPCHPFLTLEWKSKNYRKALFSNERDGPLFSRASLS